MKTNRIVIEVISLIIAAIFIYTGMDKLWHFSLFRGQLKESPWHLLSSFSYIIAWVLPIAELALSCMLLWPRLRKGGLILSIFLFGAFLGYLEILLHSGTRLPCSCGGFVSSMTWQEHIYFNIVLLLLAITGLFLDKRHSYFNQHPTKQVSVE